MKFKIRNSADGQFYFVITARNGQIIALSETYKDKKNCLKTIGRINKAFSIPKPIVDKTK
jgi:uncharacterized protein YegP (UPF0339 family)